MKTSGQIIALCLIGLSVAACKTTVNTNDTDVKVKGHGVEIEVENDGKGDFCPPGQAKKGNC